MNMSSNRIHRLKLPVLPGLYGQLNTTNSQFSIQVGKVKSIVYINNQSQQITIKIEYY